MSCFVLEDNAPDDCEYIRIETKRVTELLKSSGFSGTQLMLIGDALREAGLEIRPTTADC